MRNDKLPQLGQEETPYWTALQEQAGRLQHRLQAPGHAGSLDGAFVDLLGAQWAHYDVSVVHGLDVALPGQAAPLAQAERLAADAVGAAACAFLTTGASGVAKALTSALVDVARGRRILVARNAHISVIHELDGRGALVEILPVEMHPLGMATVLDPAVLRRALAKGDVGGVWVSTPCYEGVLGATGECIEAANAAGVPVVVDGSWASELPFSGLDDQNPIRLGADAVVGSPHKTLRAPGQVAWAFLGKSGRIPLDVFEAATTRNKSTSKSSLLIAGLDLCRHDAVHNADAGIRANRAAVEECRGWLPQGMLVDWDEERRAGRTIAPSSIPYRMTFRTWETGYTGYELATRLREQYGVQVAQPNYLYLSMGTGVGRPDTIRAACEAMRSLLTELPHRSALDPDDLPGLTLSTALVDFGEARGDIERVPLEEAVGRRLVHPIGAYPPGLALKAPTETLDATTAEYLTVVKGNGATLYGTPGSLLSAGLVAVYR